MSDKIKIERISIKIGDRRINLSAEEARLLKEELDTLFAKEKELVPFPYPFPLPYTHPIWIYDKSTPYWKYTVTCYDSNGSSGNLFIDTTGKGALYGRLESNCS